MSAQAHVYVNWGRLVADCGYGGCSDARLVETGQRLLQCVSGHLNDLVWDPSLPAVMTVLSERAEERRRNWFPRDHPLAVRVGQPHGQTLTELNAEHERGIAGGI